MNISKYDLQKHVEKLKRDEFRTETSNYLYGLTGEEKRIVEDSLR